MLLSVYCCNPQYLQHLVDAQYTFAETVKSGTDLRIHAVFSKHDSRQDFSRLNNNLGLREKAQD
jgi:hypothetical protein